MNVTQWINSKVYWFVELRKDTSPGWIISSIKSGPSSPADRAREITMRLYSDKRLDANAPPCLSGKHNIASVSLTIENYGRHWFLLLGKDEIDPEVEDSSSSDDSIGSDSDDSGSSDDGDSEDSASESDSD
jgi:hypothetical protein